jgi:hypothetical protein
MGRDILGGNGIADEHPIFRHMAGCPIQPSFGWMGIFPNSAVV